MEYQDTDLGIHIYFKCEEMDLREVGIVSTALHRAFNEGFIQGLELPSLIGHRWSSYHDESPLLISLVVSNLEYGSLSADIKPKIHGLFKNLSIGVVSSLIASTVWYIGDSANRQATVEMPSEKPQTSQRLDVGDNVREMINTLSKTDKYWELQIEDQNTGTKVIIRSRN